MWFWIKTAFEFGPLFVWALMLLTVVRPLRLSRGGRVLLATVLLAASQKFLIFRIFGGDSFVPELPERLVNFLGWTYSSSMILFALSCVWGVVRRMTKYPSPRCVISILAAVAMAIAGWGVWAGVRVPDVRRVEIAIDGLPPAFDGFRIVHLTDLHCSSAARRGRTLGIVERVNELNPDLVCITGDLVDGRPDRRADDLSPLRDLRARYGVYGCDGNHEYFGAYERWHELFAAWGITMLRNEHRVIEKDGARLALGGVTDPAVLLRRPEGLAYPDVREAFRGAPSNACRILLQHRPLLPKTNEEEGVRLQLSGHTHGGAIRGFDLLVARMGNHGFVRGFYQVGRMALYVNSGTGQWAGFPLRLGVPAEIAEIVLRAK